jgi:hypothetical protein
MKKEHIKYILIFNLILFMIGLLYLIFIDFHLLTWITFSFMAISTGMLYNTWNQLGRP